MAGTLSYKDLLGPDGTENNMGGTQAFFSFARYADHKTFAKAAAAPTDPDDAYVLTVAPVMNTGAKYNRMYCTVDTSELESGSNGDIDGKSFKPTFKFFYPGSRKDAIAFANRCKNDKFILVVALSDGTQIQIGSEGYPAYMTPNFKTDKTSGRGKGFEFEAFAYSPDPMTITAALPYVPAT